MNTIVKDLIGEARALELNFLNMVRRLAYVEPVRDEICSRVGQLF